ARLQTAVQIRNERGVKGASEFVATGDGDRLVSRIGGLLQAVERRESVSLNDRDHNLQASAARTRVMIAAGSIASLGLVLVAVFSVNRDMKARQRAERAA